MRFGWWWEGWTAEFDSAKARGARQLPFFEQFLGGAVQPGEGAAPTGGLALPIPEREWRDSSHHEPLERFQKPPPAKKPPF